MRFLLASVLLLAACVSVDYMGKSYPPTDNVDVYYSMDAVERPHEVMGQAQAEAGEGVKMQKIQDELVADAMTRGADGIVMGEVGTVDKTSTSYSTTNGSGGGHGSTVATTTIQHDTIIKATLIKYTD
ncbi:MAG: hypothetical protein ACI8QZ_000133 [Chlamydiales bacterium]|jgi:hypothetical protein